MHCDTRIQHAKTVCTWQEKHYIPKFPEQFIAFFQSVQNLSFLIWQSHMVNKCVGFNEHSLTAEGQGDIQPRKSHLQVEWLELAFYINRRDRMLQDHIIFKLQKSQTSISFIEYKLVQKF